MNLTELKDVISLNSLNDSFAQTSQISIKDQPVGCTFCGPGCLGSCSGLCVACTSCTFISWI